MPIVPYLNFNGDCREAFDFYAATLGGKVEFLQTFGETPMAEHAAPELRDKVMHASLRLPDGDALLASDAPPEMYKPAQGLWVSLHVKDPGEAERAFRAFADGGTVVMGLEKTFWSPAFGMVTDRFGTPWMINCDAPA